MPACLVTVTARDGAYRRELRPGDEITFGRSSACELTIPDDPRLSRRAGRIAHLGPAVEVTNLSTSHSLFVRSPADPRQRLLPARVGEPAPARLLAAGVHDITGPPGSDGSCRIVVRVAAAATAAAVDAPTASDHPVPTAVALTLNPATKEFATALVLCRSKLLDGPTAPVPAIPELTRAVLRATGSQHLLARFDEDTPAGAGGRRRRGDRDRLVGRVHEYLRQLRDKVYTAGLTTTRELRPHELADVLIDNDVIVPAHLLLLTDPGWLTGQEELWWHD